MKQIDLTVLDSILKDDMSIMFGGFLGVGTPEKIIDYLVEKNIKNITLICNDTSFPDRGVGKLIVNKQVKKVITSHIGTNPETGRQMIANETEVDLVPQGSLAEKIRCGGSGLGGVLTKTGLGTEVSKSREKVYVNGEEFLLETPLRADLALIYATKADEKGNLVYHGSTRNFNPIMAMAADVVVAEAMEIVKVGELDHSNIIVPHIFVDYLVKGE